MDKLLLAAIAAAGIVSASAAFAADPEEQFDRVQVVPPGPLATSSTAFVRPPTTGGVEDQQTVDGIPGASYGYGSAVSPSGDSVTYSNTVPPN
ncbi:MAG TPA: hypothetical protein VHS58_06715 [Acetobacteraceae bacterium]|jgi:hypothetical protein|nr:hypothetical protein [Acetobacteraceae bacterium]